ncbi:MAG TPA: mannitol dehydrogenase family protein [Microbacteriaceae bacterium]|jgi:mannitol 2-dehydrogenase|nr:mannitol dehydrogenase family protein [Microbacteriaceae bacterium]
MSRLSTSALGSIEAMGISTPHYDRAALAPRILHLGVGGFHRAHLALYVHELAAEGGDWGIRGLGRLDNDRRMAGVLASQDHLYTLVERDSQGSRPQIVGSIVDFALALADEDAFARRIADPQVAILSMTITEGGYSLEQTNPTIEAIASGLERRRVSGGRPLTILSCDNLPGNGRVARQAVMTVCETRNPELARFVETACTFPNSMVDRITPQTTDDDRAWLRDEFGIDDRWPVVAEPFRQWVIEDQFAGARPRFEDVGVLFTDDVHDWELYKLRMLNATHSCMAYLMALEGVAHVDEAMAIPAVRRYLERFLSAEAIPTLTEIPGYPAAAYGRTVLVRYENTGVRDQIARLCIDGTAKFPTFLIPTIERQLELGGPLECSVLALAGWARYLATIPATERAPDPRGERSAALAARSLEDPLAFLELADVFTPPLRESLRFRDAFAHAVASLSASGPLGAIDGLSAG